MRLTVRKHDPGDPSRCRFDEARSLYAWTAYEVSVVAADFRDDVPASACWMDLVRTGPGSSDPVVFASCQLAEDPLRRDRRIGTLVVGDSDHADMLSSLVSSMAVSAADPVGMTVVHDIPVDDAFRLRVRMGASADVVLDARVPLVLGPRPSVLPSSPQSGTAPSPRPTTADLWRTVDAGERTIANSRTVVDGVEGLAIPVSDRTIVECSIDLAAVGGSRRPVVLVPQAPGPVFEACVVVELVDSPSAPRARSWASAGTAGGVEDVLGDVFVGAVNPPVQAGSYDAGAVRPSWDYDDSRTLASPVGRFMFRLARMPAVGWRAEFRVVGAAPVGAERDPDGTDVPGSGVNGGED